MKRFWHNNGLSIVFFLMFLFSWGAQAITGWKVHNQDVSENGGKKTSFIAYLTTGHFIEATFENWESEFLQSATFIAFAAFLYQKGSSESKDPDKKEEVDKEPDPNKKDAPKVVHRGGLVLSLYKNSLSIIFFSLFVLCFVLHWYGSMRHYNEEQALKQLPTQNMWQYAGNVKLWFESFQNWQSEFLSVFCMIVFSIVFRQKSSPQSKPVDAPDHQTGK